jgi:polar amino acid transport system substrate-binding protein
MKKFLAFLLIVAMATVAFASCNSDKTIVVGYTIYEPMNFTDDEGNLIGFDTDLAKAVLEDKLGYTVIFKKIEWDQKYIELEAGTIDCIWNGFTANVTDDDGVARADKVDFSYNYMLNKQVVVTSKALAESVTGFDSLSGKVGGVEKGSAGEGYLEKLTGSVKKPYTSQLEALKDLSLGAVDFVVLDEQLATAYVGKGSYAELSVVTSLSGDPEYYAIGFKKGSELTEKVNKALEELAAEGVIDTIASRYNLVTAITDFSDPEEI